MNKQWGLWVFLGIMVGVVIVAVNMQGRRSTTEIFPEDEFLTDIEYQYETAEGEPAGDLKAIDSSQTTQEAVTAGVIQDTTETKAPSTDSQQTISSPAPAVATAPTTKSIYTIQVAAFKDRSRAELELRKIKAMGYDAMMQQADLGDKGVWYRVYVGPFDDKNEAISKLGALKSSYGQGFIRKISP